MSAVIPRRDVTDAGGGAALSYRISVSDGYSTDTNPTYPVVVSDKGFASVGGHPYVAANPALYVDDDADLAGVGATATPVVLGTPLPVAVARGTTNGEGRYTISDLPGGRRGRGPPPRVVQRRRG